MSKTRAAHKETLTPIPRGSSAVYFPVSRSSIQIPQKSYLLYLKKMRDLDGWKDFKKQALSKNGDQYLYNSEKLIEEFVEEFLMKPEILKMKNMTFHQN